MSQLNYDWDDIRLVLAIIKGKGLSGASRILKVHHATVLRRLDIFEQKLGVILFARGAQGYHPTPLAESLLERSRGLNDHMAEMFQLLEGSDMRLSGVIRLATADFLAQNLIAMALPRLKASHPDIVVEVLVSAQITSLGRRDADVALRVMQDKALSSEENFQPLHKISYAAYAHRELLDRYDRAEDIPWIADDEMIASSSVRQWLNAYRGDAKVAARANNMMTKFALVRSGLGAGILPSFLAKTDQNLQSIVERPDWHLILAFGCHPDLRNMPRIKALKSCLMTTLKSFGTHPD